MQEIYEHSPTVLIKLNKIISNAMTFPMKKVLDLRSDEKS